MAGNSAKTTVSDVDIDKTPATITILSPQAVTYHNTDPFAATWEARDALSGILSQAATMDGARCRRISSSRRGGSMSS